MERQINITKKPTYEALEKRILKLEKKATSHQKVKTELQKSEQKYRDMLENIEDGYCELDLKGNFTFVNNYMFKILGYRPKALQKMSGWDVMDEENCKKVFKSFNEIHRTRISSKGFDYEIIRKDGIKRQIEVSASLILDDHEKPLGFRSIVRDITDRKKSEKALRKAHNELERRVIERTSELAEINKELEVKTINLEEANTALRVLLKKKDETRQELEEQVLLNVKELVVPFIEKLKTVAPNKKQRTYISVLENMLNGIISGFSRNLSSVHYNLTPTELQVASLVKDGKSTKEISKLMNLSDKTIETHRRNIREKTGIKNQKINLRTHLLAME